MKQGDTVKLVIAIVILIAAGILIAWNFGVFSGPTAPAPVEGGTPEAPARGQPRTAPGVAPSSSLPARSAPLA